MRHRRGIDLVGAGDEIAGQKANEVTFCRPAAVVFGQR